MSLTKPDLALIRVRPAGRHEVGFIASSWIRGIIRESYEPSRVTVAIIHRDLAPHISAWVESHLNCLRVLEFKAAPDEIVAWSAHEEGRLHWVHTKRAYRGHGFGAHLVESSEAYEFTHTSKSFSRFLVSTKKSFLYAPYPFLMDKLFSCPHGDYAHGSIESRETSQGHAVAR